jgi:AAA ATPase domain
VGSGLVGRVAEVVALDRLRAAAAAGSGATALLVGEPGIGKTAVVEEAVSRAAAAGATVLTGRAEPDEGAPAYWPWLRLLQSAPAGLSPDLLDADDGAGESAAAARFRVAQRTVRALEAAGPLVLVLEDLHWADSASIALLRTLCVEITGTAILVIGTVRQPDDGFRWPSSPGCRASRCCRWGRSSRQPSGRTLRSRPALRCTVRGPPSCTGSAAATHCTSASWRGCSPAATGCGARPPTSICRTACGGSWRGVPRN